MWGAGCGGGRPPSLLFLSSSAARCVADASAERLLARDGPHPHGADDLDLGMQMT